MRCVAPLAAVCALVLPAAAHGAIVGVVPARDPGSTNALYTADRGETNDVEITIEKESSGFDHVAEFHDAGAPLTAGKGCVQIGPNRARCKHLAGAEIRVGDRNDSVTTHMAPSEYRFDLSEFGGPGADTLTGSRYEQWLYGGDGADTISGAAGRDQLSGGPGRDHLDGGKSDDLLTGESFERTPSADSDDIVGGRGSDVVYYYGGTDPVDVDLARGVGSGAPGEDDRLHEVEDVALATGTGTIAGDERGNDLTVYREAGGAVLRGRGGSDELSGGDDPDLIYGGRGNDVLKSGGAMGDRLYAGRGHDTLFAGKTFDGIGSGWSRAVHCGRGTDLVHSSRRHDILSRDCEEASSYARLGIAPDVRRVGDHALELSLHRRGPHTSCRYAIRLRGPFPQRRHTRAREMGRLVFRLDRKTWRRIRIELNERGRRLLRRERPIPVWVEPGERDRCKPGYTLGFGPDGFTALL